MHHAACLACPTGNALTTLTTPTPTPQHRDGHMKKNIRRRRAGTCVFCGALGCLSIGTDDGRRWIYIAYARTHHARHHASNDVHPAPTPPDTDSSSDEEDGNGSGQEGGGKKSLAEVGGSMGSTHACKSRRRPAPCDARPLTLPP